MSSKDELQKMNIKLEKTIQKIDEIHAHIFEVVPQGAGSVVKEPKAEAPKKK